MTDRVLGTLTPQQALIYAMITMSAVDNKMADAELKRIGSIVKQLPVFSTYDPDDLLDDTRACGAVAAGTDGLHRVLDLITASVPSHLGETVYMLACEVAAVDGALQKEELRFLQLLSSALQLERLTCVALERAARARYQRA